MIDLADVRLRKLEEYDVEELYIFRNDAQVTQSLGGFSSGYSRKDLAEWIDYHRTRHDEILWAIASKSTDKCVGHVGLYKIDHRVAKAEFAIVIGSRDCQGKGVGRRVSTAILDYGFRELRLNKISLSVLSANAQARALYDSLGFRLEGQLRDEQYRGGEYQTVILMAMFADHWKELNQGSTS